MGGYFESRIKAMADLWKAFVYVTEDKVCDKETYSWGKLLVYAYDTKSRNGFNGNECDFIYEFYNRLKTDEDFANAIDKLYRILYTNTLFGL